MEWALEETHSATGGRDAGHFPGEYEREDITKQVAAKKQLSAGTLLPALQPSERRCTAPTLPNTHTHHNARCAGSTRCAFQVAVHVLLIATP